MKLIIHRGAHEVGGSCVEISCGGSTILVDIGLPLDFDSDESIESCLPQSLFHTLRQGGKFIDGVLLSHPHLDHYGLAGQLPASIPVYCGKASWDLMNATARFSPNKFSLPNVEHFEAWQEFQLGNFTITSYLMDHSAFDAYGFLISASGKNIFYSGDFRGHGRKSKLLDRLPKLLPSIDALLMEGTLIGNRSNEIQSSESELEDEFVKIIEQTQGITLVTTSSQNIDRLVTIFKAVKRCDRMFIIDFYTAEILEILKEYAKLPNATWPRIRVCYPQFLARQFEKKGMVMLVRPGFMADIKRFVDLNRATWIYSMWLGYFERSQSLQKLKSFLLEQGVHYEYLHTSGHASLNDLKEFVRKLSPQMTIPIHSFHPEQFHDLFANVKMIADGEEINI